MAAAKAAARGLDISEKSNLSGGSFFSFGSVGTLNPLGAEGCIHKNDDVTKCDVFGKSIIDFDVWMENSPEFVGKPTISIPTTTIETTKRKKKKPSASISKTKNTGDAKTSGASSSNNSKTAAAAAAPPAMTTPRHAASKTTSLSLSSSPRIALVKAALAAASSPKPTPIRTLMTPKLITPKAITSKPTVEKTKTKSKRNKEKDQEQEKLSSESSKDKDKEKKKKKKSSALASSTHSAGVIAKSKLEKMRKEDSSKSLPTTPVATTKRTKRKSSKTRKDDDKKEASPQTLELAPILDNINPTRSSESSSSSSRPRSKSASAQDRRRRRRSSTDEFKTDDRIAELMDLLRRETEPPPVKSRSLPIKLEVPSDPQEFRKKLLEDAGDRKSYLPKRVSGRVYGSDFRKTTRRDSVKDSLKNYIDDTSAASGEKRGGSGGNKSVAQTVFSDPVISKTPKVRASRAAVSSNKDGSNRSSSRTRLESHLRSTRITKGGTDGEMKSIASAPLTIREKCQNYNMAF